MDYNTASSTWVEQYAGDAAGPRPEPIDAAHWQRRLDGAREAPQGARRPARHPAARRRPRRRRRDRRPGTLNKNIATGAPSTNDSIFQIGSISKVWTATVVMRLVDQGKIALDTKVADILPGFRLVRRRADRRRDRSGTC